MCQSCSSTSAAAMDTRQRVVQWMGGTVDGGRRWSNTQDTHTILLSLRPSSPLSPSMLRPPAPAAADCLNETNRQFSTRESGLRANGK